MNSIATAESAFSGLSKSSYPTSFSINEVSTWPEMLLGSRQDVFAEIKFAGPSIDNSSVIGNLSSPYPWYVSSIKENPVDSDFWLKVSESGRNRWKERFPTGAVNFVELVDSMNLVSKSAQLVSTNSYEAFAKHAWHRSWNFHEMIEAVTKLTEFPEDWNGCGGVPLSGENFARSVDLLYLLSEHGVHKPYLYPSPRGGLIAEVGAKKARITIIIDSDIGLLHVSGEHDQMEFEFSEKDGFSSLLARLDNLLER